MENEIENKILQEYSKKTNVKYPVWIEALPWKAFNYMKKYYEIVNAE